MKIGVALANGKFGSYGWESNCLWKNRINLMNEVYG